MQRTLSSGSSAAAEFIADIFLCPLEATRIRLVSNPSYASGRETELEEGRGLFFLFGTAAGIA